MSERQPLGPGDFLYHNSAHPCETFTAEAENVVFFGTTRESILFAGSEGFCSTYLLIEELPLQGEYGGRNGWGQRNDWVSIPSEVATEILTHVETEEL
jgi:hypothetical protein